jgi:hypothetical protein
MSITDAQATPTDHPAPATGPAPVPSVGETASTSERQDAARDAYLVSVQAGTPLTGAHLGERFGRTDRWGRLQIRKFRDELAAGDPSGNGDGAGSGVSAVRQDPDTSSRVGSVGRSGPARAVPVWPDAAASAVDEHDRTVVPFVAGSVPARADAPAGNGRAAGPERARGDVSAPAGTTGGVETPAEHRPVDMSSGDPAAEVPPRSWLDVLNKVVLALVCAAASYGHMYHVALLAGEPVWIARAWPITVDGLVIAALRRGHDGRTWLAVGIAVSIGANVFAQFPGLAESAGPFVSAWPPIALYGAHRLSHARRHPPAGPTEAPTD